MAWEYFTGYPPSKLSENKIWYALAIVLASTLQPQPLLVTATTTGGTTLLTGTHLLLGYLWWQWSVSIPWSPCYSKAPWHRREHELELTTGCLVPSLPSLTKMSHPALQCQSSQITQPREPAQIRASWIQIYRLFPEMPCRWGTQSLWLTKVFNPVILYLYNKAHKRSWACWSESRGG